MASRSAAAKHRLEAVTRELEGSNPPRRFDDLVRATSESDPKALTRLFQGRPSGVMLIRPRVPKGRPAVAPGDALLYRPDELADPTVLAEVVSRTLAWAENKASSAFSAAELEGEVAGKPGKDVRKALEAAFEAELPPGVGALRRKGTWVFARTDRFLAQRPREGVKAAPRHLKPERPSEPRLQRSSVRSTSAPPRSSEAETSKATPAARDTSRDFGQDFDQAFAQLDAEHRGLNFVKLAALREALAQYDRASFDAGLRRLRIENRYDLVPNEGTHLRLSDEERAAGIVEAGSRLVICRRVEPSEY